MKLIIVLMSLVVLGGGIGVDIVMAQETNSTTIDIANSTVVDNTNSTIVVEKEKEEEKKNTSLFGFDLSFGFDSLDDFEDKVVGVIEDVQVVTGNIDGNNIITSTELKETTVDVYHIGIRLDSVCEKLNALNDSDKCPTYEEIDEMFPTTRMKEHLKPNFEDYDINQQLRFNFQLKSLQKDCIINGYCDFFDIKKDQTVVIWHNPEAELENVMDIINIRNGMRISSIYHVAQQTIISVDNTIKNAYINQALKMDQYDNNIVEIAKLERVDDTNKDTTNQSKRNITSLERQLNDHIVWMKYNKDDLEFKEEREKKLLGLEESLKLEKEKQTESSVTYTESSTGLKELKAENIVILTEIRDLSKSIRDNKSKLKPMTNIDIENVTRSITYNVNQLYVDQSCKKSFFRFDNFAVELQSLINYMQNDCNNTDLLLTFELTHKKIIPKHEFDITTSPNWQYQQWLETARESCKQKC